MKAELRDKEIARFKSLTREQLDAMHASAEKVLRRNSTLAKQPTEAELRAATEPQ